MLSSSGALYKSTITNYRLLGPTGNWLVGWFPSLTRPMARGVHPPEAMMHFPTLFQIPPIFEKFSDSVENFRNFTFSRIFFRFSDFHPPKFSHRPRISNLPPIFPVSVHFPSVSRKLFFPPTFTNFPPCFRKIPLLFTYFMCISFPPYFDYDAFMHHPMHVLDFPVYMGFLQ